MTNVWHLAGDLVLASGSHFKQRLLKNAGFTATHCPVDIDESEHPNEKPQDYVRRVALEKAKAAHKQCPQAFVLGADTIIAVGDIIVRKAKTEEEARHTLSLLSGTTHQAMTGYAIVTPDGQIVNKVVITQVSLKVFTPVEIQALIESGEWRDVAAYKSEGILSALITGIQGSYPNVVGLPVYDIAEDLKRLMPQKKA